jgi:hypothetical protein
MFLDRAPFGFFLALSLLGIFLVFLWGRLVVCLSFGWRSTRHHAKAILTCPPSSVGRVGALDPEPWCRATEALGPCSCRSVPKHRSRARITMAPHPPSGYIAQWLERLTADQQVPGSNPGVSLCCRRLGGSLRLLTILPSSPSRTRQACPCQEAFGHVRVRSLPSPGHASAIRARSR